MGFLNKLMIHLNNATKVALDESNNTLDKKLYSFLSKMLESDANGKMISGEIQEINEDVVYFVLNGTDIRTNERAFVAGMNWAKLDESIIGRTFLEGTSLVGVSPESETGNRTLLYSTKKENLEAKIEDAQYINQCWNLVWEDYLRLTKDEEKNGLLTFNHWLLNKTKHPLNIGVYWGEELKKNEVDGGYFHLPEETLRKLSAGKIKEIGFNPLQLPRNFLNSYSYDRALNEIKTHMGEMEQDDDAFNNVKNIGFAVYHIIRSYGCWGGASFYSIPINIRFTNERRIGILSICSKKPLNESLIERWSLVATKILMDIIPFDISLFSELQRQNQLIEATYGISHLFGNLIGEFETPFTVLKGYANDEKNRSDTIKNICKMTEEIEIGFSKFKDVSKIILILAKATKEKDSIVFERKGWNLKEPLDLYELIKNLERKNIDGKKCRVEFADINAITITPFIKSCSILPAKFIYENMLLELLINCMKHYADKVTDKKMIVRFEAGRLIFKNIAKPDTIVDWREIDNANSNGAILYLAFLFRETRIGNIYRRRIKENDIHFFEIGIELNGININIVA